MKKLLLVILLFSTFAACRKDIMERSEYWAVTDLNGERWETETGNLTVGRNNVNHWIHLDQYNDFGELRQKLSFILDDTIPEVGERITLMAKEEFSAESLKRYAMFTYCYADGDACGISYTIPSKDTHDNYLMITDIAPDTSYIEGEFSVYLEKEHKNVIHSNPEPESLHFTSGKFRVETFYWQ